MTASTLGASLSPELRFGPPAGVETLPLVPPEVGEPDGETKGADAVGEMEGAAEEDGPETLMSTRWPRAQWPGMPQKK